MAAYRINSQGYIEYNGQRLIPIGVNYWPGSVGVEMWTQWPADEIQRDLDLAAANQLNTIRFFLRWQDFEPEAGHYSDVQFDRLRLLLTWFRERSLHAHPSLFVGWMSGGIFWPKWREGRNLFSDAFMLERSIAFARKAGHEMASFADCILAVDQGNELDCLSDCSSATPAAILNWCREVNAAVREGLPDCLIVSGNDQQQVSADTGWRLGDQPGCDFYSIHTYPVPAWHHVPFDGMTDPMGQSLLPFYVKVARNFGPVMVQEFGSILTSGVKQQDAYIRSILPACWNEGAMGFLWWSLRDITAPVEPYLSTGMESKLGLFDEKGRIKPGLEFFLEFNKTVNHTPPELPAREIGLYFPGQYYNRELFGAANDPRSVSRNMLWANHLFQENGYRTRIVRTPADLDASPSVLLVASCILTTVEAAALGRWVQAGGRLIWHGPDPINWAASYEEVIGARAVDFRINREAHYSLFGSRWSCQRYPRDWRVQVEATTARILASTEEEGIPVVLLNHHGKGEVLTVMHSVEADIAADAASSDPTSHETWKRWYRSVIDTVSGDSSTQH